MPRLTSHRDRGDAGRRLAQWLRKQLPEREEVLVLAFPRGGVPVGYEVARDLELPLDVIIVRKLGLPGQPELAMGAIASGGPRVVNDDVVRAAGVDEETLDEVERRERAYLGEKANGVVCPFLPRELFAIGIWYQEFPQLTDDEVREILRRAWSEKERRSPPEEEGDVRSGELS